MEKPQINVIIQGKVVGKEKQKLARAELQDHVFNTCQKYDLCYYEIFGILEAIKLDLQYDVSFEEEEEEGG